MCEHLNEKGTEGCCLSFCLAESFIDVGDIFQVGSHSRSQVLEFLSERNVLSAKDNIVGDDTQYNPVIAILLNQPSSVFHPHGHHRSAFFMLTKFYLKSIEFLVFSVLEF
jgi:hypothetical protein